MKTIDSPAAIVLNLSYTGLGIARSLHGEGIKVLGLGSKKWAPGNYSRFVDFILSPDSQEEPEALCEFLVELAQKTGLRGIIFPTRDHDIIFLRENHKFLDSCYIFSQPGAENLDAILDKWKLYNAALSCGIESPRTALIESLEQATKLSSEIAYPAVLKPVLAADWRKKGIWEAVGQTKAIVAQNKNDMVQAYSRFCHLQSRVLIQEYIEGEDSDIFTFCSYKDRKGEILAHFNTQKILQRPPKLGTGIVVKSVSKPELESPSRKLLTFLNFYGVSEIEYKRDPRTGKYYLIEINPRFWDQHRLGLCRGVNLPLIAYRDLAGMKSLMAEKDCSQSKTWIAEHSFMTTVAGSLRYGFHEPMALMKKVRGPKEYALWNRKDPVPFILATFRMAVNYLHKMFRLSRSNGRDSVIA